MFEMRCSGTARGSLCVVCRIVESEAHFSLRDTGLRHLPAAKLLFYEA